MGQYITSGIKVLDRAVLIMNTVSAEPCSLSELCERTELPRATTHRLASALETHRILSRDSNGRWSIGPAFASIGSDAKDHLISAATPVMADLVARTGESVQIYQLTGATRTCIAAQEPPSGLQNTVPVGSQMSLAAGSAAKVFLAFAPQLQESLSDDAAFTRQDLDEVRKAGLAESVAEREVGLASLSAPVFNSAGMFVAVISISGPAERLRPHPAKKWGTQLQEAASELSSRL